MVDIAALKTGERTLEILHPGTHKPLGIRWKLVHIDDERLVLLKRQVTDENQRLQARGKYFKADDLKENTNRLITTASTGWEWYNPTGGPADIGYDPDEMPEFDGDTAPEFNPKNVKLIINQLPWIKDQVSEAIGDLEGFFAKSPGS